VSQGGSGESRVARRRARRSPRWGGSRVRTLAIAAGAVIVVGAIVATWLVVDHNRDSARQAGAIAATSTTGMASPYDLTELPADTDRDVIADASFVSILIPNDAGKLTSYGINAKLPGVQALAEAIMNAEEVSVATTATTTADAAGAVSGSSNIFVMPSHGTMTFSLDSAQGLVARGGKAWRPKGDLKALMKAATSAPK
jgi:hypothetical protein